MTVGELEGFVDLVYYFLDDLGVAVLVLGEGFEGGLPDAVDEYNPVWNLRAIAL